MSGADYILLTAARNEQAHIEETLRAVAAQTSKPIKWLIVSDGSTDRTDEIVAGRAASLPFIELMRADADPTRNFGSKAKALRAGYERVKQLPAAFVGILDADVSFEPGYYEQVIHRMLEDPSLGIAGGVLLDRSKQGFIPQITDPEWSVSGPIQMFRKECFDAIGGYLPIRGGIDAAAEVMARMKGWKVKAFADLRVLHLRPTGTEQKGVGAVFFSRGVEDYQLGYHPVFFTARVLRRFQERPWVAGGLLMLAGYAWAALRRAPRKVPPEFVRFLRAEQMGRLRARFRARRGGAS